MQFNLTETQSEWLKMTIQLNWHFFKRVKKKYEHYILQEDGNLLTVSDFLSKVERIKCLLKGQSDECL